MTVITDKEPRRAPRSGKADRAIIFHCPRPLKAGFGRECRFGRSSGASGFVNLFRVLRQPLRTDGDGTNFAGHPLQPAGRLAAMKWDRRAFPRSCDCTLVFTIQTMRIVRQPAVSIRISRWRRP
jgi:hypothetical protein